MSVLLLSGGLDSLVLLAREVSEGKPPLCVSFDYGQRHVRELSAAAEIARHYGVPHEVCALPCGPLEGSALTGGGDVPVGLHFTDPMQSATVVPCRNAVLLSFAAAYAVKWGRQSVLFAAHLGDAPVYSDCRPAFVAGLSIVFWNAYGVTVEAPFLGLDKAGIVRLGRQLGAPLHLSWSCYQGGDVPCGRCGACVERAEAMSQ